jgi:hypothetical protein
MGRGRSYRALDPTHWMVTGLRKVRRVPSPHASGERVRERGSFYYIDTAKA